MNFWLSPVGAVRVGVVACCLLVLGLIPFIACGTSNTVTPPPTLPTPTPTPTPRPTPTPDPFLATCMPTPTPIYGMKIKLHVGRILDSRPIVANIDDYCARTGSSATAPYCDTRPEGDLQREACDAMAVGKAKDTGRYGPTWTFNGEPCLKPDEVEGPKLGCVNNPDNQFLVNTKGQGLYLACPDVGPCADYLF